MSNSEAGKGDTPRNLSIPWQLADLKFLLATEKISYEVYLTKVQELRDQGIDVDTRLAPRPISGEN